MNSFPHAWWEVMEVSARPDIDLAGATFLSWRNNMIGQAWRNEKGTTSEKRLSARDFDNAKRAGLMLRNDTPFDWATRFVWYLEHAIAPIFVRPVGYKWTEAELDFLRSHSEHLEAVFLEYDLEGIDRVEGPRA